MNSDRTPSDLYRRDMLVSLPTERLALIYSGSTSRTPTIHIMGLGSVRRTDVRAELASRKAA